MVSAGRILILPQGTWDNATMYNMLDLVAYNGISWLCKRQCVGITPSVTATEYWQQFGSSAPIASTTVAGLVMPDGQTITINTTTGAIAVPTATAAALGLVKVDGTSITIDANGVISSAGGNLSNLGDVAITSLTNGQVLIWNQTNQKWQNGTIAGALSALSDVTITSATDEQILVYDSTAQKWKNATAQATLSNSTKPVQTAVVKKALTDVVETVGAGASQAYSEGDIILGNDGTYYKATTDIAQNTTLTVGGNIQATNNRALITNLTQQLTADNGQTFRYGYDSTSGKYGYYVKEAGTDVFVPFSTGGEGTFAKATITHNGPAIPTKCYDADNNLLYESGSVGDYNTGLRMKTPAFETWYIGGGLVRIDTKADCYIDNTLIQANTQFQSSYMYNSEHITEVVPVWS